MKLTGYGGFLWEPSGYWVSTDEATMLINEVQPTVLNRPGTYPTFGLSVVGAMYIPCIVGYSGVLPFETAYLNFFKRLNPANIDITQKRFLTAVRNDGVTLSIVAQAMIPQVNASGDFNTRAITFVCCEPFWSDQAYSTGSTTYT